MFSEPSAFVADEHRMSNADALAYLKNRERFGIKFGLENIDRIAERMGRPEHSFGSILIAGTNGKGSTAALVESMLRAAGKTTGLYTSPHIQHLEERVRVLGRPISQQELAVAVGRVAHAVHTQPQRAVGALTEPTFFEAVTACAFAAFRARGVELAVLEVGMGGRWDATNIVPALVSAITPIGFDHEKFLGTTLAAIAAEKAAIIKPGRPVVVGRLEPEALRVVEDEAAKNDAPLHCIESEVELDAVETATGHRVWLRTPQRVYERLELPLRGSHQLDNLAQAVRILELTMEDPSFGRLTEPAEDIVARGVAQTEWRGRLQRIEGEPPLLLDAAHNVMAAAALGRFLREHPREGRVLLFGVMKDKRVEEMLDHLLPHVTELVATRPKMSRARRPEGIAEFARGRGTPAEAVATSAEGLQIARDKARSGGEVIVAGSIFLLGEVQTLLDEERLLVPAPPAN